MYAAWSKSMSHWVFISYFVTIVASFFFPLLFLLLPFVLLINLVNESTSESDIYGWDVYRHTCFHDKEKCTFLFTGYFWHVSDFHFDANLTEDGPHAGKTNNILWAQSISTWYQIDIGLFSAFQITAIWSFANYTRFHQSNLNKWLQF